MSIFLVIAAIVLVLVYLYLRQRNRSYINAIRSGEADVLMRWSYAPEDWDWYAGDPSSRWIKHRNLPGEVFITPESILVTNGRDHYLFKFGGDRKLTQSSFYHSFLDLRAEWTTEPDDDALFGYQDEQLTFYHEDFRLYIPNSQQEKGLKLAAEFQAKAAANAAFARKFIKGDEVISLFGSDEPPVSRKKDKDHETISLFGNDEP